MKRKMLSLVGCIHEELQATLLDVALPATSAQARTIVEVKTPSLVGRIHDQATPADVTSLVTPAKATQFVKRRKTWKTSSLVGLAADQQAAKQHGSQPCPVLSPTLRFDAPPTLASCETPTPQPDTKAGVIDGDQQVVFLSIPF